ncbi:MAG: hypothetical protein IJV44_01580 [Prevotella sp.]|nr:hypothetical protein [Prevotella sp.]
MKKVITRKGDIFCVEIGNEYKSYFQYITTDMTQMNSTVIRVFKKHYPMDYIPNMDEIIQDEVYFYAHTVLRPGLQVGAWYKVGTSKNVGEIDNIMFSLFSEGNFSHLTKSYKWYIWKINQKKVFIGEMQDKYKNYNRGWIYPYTSIIHKIKTDVFLIRDLE